MKHRNPDDVDVIRNPKGHGWDVYVTTAGKRELWETTDSLTEAYDDVKKEFGVNLWPSL